MKMFSQDGCVLTCAVTQCSYNDAEECCAPDIQVGDDHPMCDTFTTSAVQKTREESAVARCMVTDCNFNQGQDCHARGITVGTHSGHADCVTFRPEM